MPQARVHPGSFRDPGGRVVLIGDRVFRTVMPAALDDFRFVRASGFVDRQVAEGRVIGETTVDPALLGDLGAGAAAVLEHPRLPFISYPYEWPFRGLQAAALLQLDLAIDGLEHGVMLSDASAYNIQFRGAQPVFIDALSFRRYRDGEFWSGHRQFCEQFLNPLILRSHCGVAHNAWYRGALEGIPTEDLARLLPWRRCLSWNVFAHVILQARLQAGARAREDAEQLVRERKLPRASLRQLMTSLRDWIAKLRPGASSDTLWSTYAAENSYASEEAQLKSRAISEFAAATRPRLLWDLGCNTGVYAEAALGAGAQCAIGFDFDQGALDQAFQGAQQRRLPFTPLYADAANPAPRQGWAQAERDGLGERANADALLALALVHHLAIGRNTPLARVVEWLVGLAPTGIIEFVPPGDPMVQRLLSLRTDAAHEYSEDRFREALVRHAEIVSETSVSASGRRLFRYQRNRRDASGEGMP